MKTRIQKALKMEPVDKVPIWFMRQAGRYLPEYRKIKEKNTFWEMVINPELAAEVTLQPIERYNLDAAIIFSDILTLLYGMGINVSFEHGPPETDRTVKNENELIQFKNEYNAAKMGERLHFYTKALQLTRKGLSDDKSLFGFAAAPYTIGSYLLEGKTSKTHSIIRAWLYSNPELFSKLLDFLADATIDYCKLQIEAGADVIQLFESWGDSIDPLSYKKYVLPHITKISKEISKTVPVVFFCRGASIHRENLLPVYNEGISAISVDWRLPIDFYGDLPVQGNLDPACLWSDPKSVEKETLKILETRGRKPGYIFNLGHGIYPETPLENVDAMVKTVQNFKL
ncbi:MAG: uroporphyrinogen decarboxylase [Spirochaetia bacterium]|nr:uroporphyrinogen decarboxylase [Spirochaetia bacterium]